MDNEHLKKIGKNCGFKEIKRGKLSLNMRLQCSRYFKKIVIPSKSTCSRLILKRKKKVVLKE